MKKYVKILLLVLICILIFGGCKDKNSNKTGESYTYQKSSVSCSQIEMSTNNVFLEENKIYAVNNNILTSSYNLSKLKNDSIVDFGVNTSDIPLSDIYFSKDKSYIVSGKENENIINIIGHNGDLLNTLTYDKNEHIYGVCQDNNENTYILYTSIATFKCNIDIYNNQFKKINTICLNDKIILESKILMFCYMTIDNDNHLYVVGSEMNMEDGNLSNYILYKLSEEYEIVSHMNLDELGMKVTNLFVISSGELVVSGTDGKLCYINIIDTYSNEIQKRYELKDVEKVFPGENGEIIYQLENEIFKLDNNNKILNCDEQIIQTSGNEQCIICTSSSYQSPVIEIIGDNGVKIDSIQTTIKNNYYINDLYVKSGIIYLMLNDLDTNEYVVYTYENKTENFCSIPYINKSDDDCVFSNLCVKDNFIYFSRDNVLFIYSIDENRIMEVCEEKISYINDIKISSEDSVVILCVQNNKMALYMVEEQTPKLKCLSELDIEPSNNDILFTGNKEYSVIINNDGNLYGYRDKSHKLEDIVALNDVGIPYAVYMAEINEDETILCVDLSNNIYKLCRVKENLEKVELKIACFGVNVAVKDQINKINEHNQEYKIVLKEYAEFANENDCGIKQFNIDLASGNIPDIIISKSTVDMEMYARMGIVEDLYPYIDKDDVIKKDNYIENIFKLNEDNGKLYTLQPQFILKTIVAQKPDVHESSWSYKDLFSYSTNKENIFYMTTCGELLQYLMATSGTKFVDLENKTAMFESDDFKSLLEFCKKNGTIEDVYDDLKANESFKNNKCALAIKNIINFSYYNILEKGVLCDDMALKGISSDGCNDVAIGYINDFSILKESQHKEEAWKIIREFLLDEYQDSLTNEGSMGFPVKRSSIEKALNSAKNTDDELLQQWINGDEIINIGVISDETAEKIINLIETTTLKYKIDAKVYSIIESEANLFFTNSQSVEETSAAIQNKVSLYLNERR